MPIIRPRPLRLFRRRLRQRRRPMTTIHPKPCYARKHSRRPGSAHNSCMKTPAYFANLAQSAYTTAPDIGIESGAARIVKVRDDAGVLFYSIPGTNNETCALV